MSFTKAYEKCKEVFLDQGYKGVGQILMSDDAWIFFPDLEGKVSYGDLPIVWPKNKGVPVYYEHTPENAEKYLKNAISIS